MSFSKRSDAAHVCHSKPLDSVKNWNDHFSGLMLSLSLFPRYYELDENCYPSFLDENNEAMDLFSFISHADPTKVRVGKIEKAGDQVSLLEATRERVVLLAPPVPATTASSEGNMTKSIDRLFDEGNGAEKEHSIGERLRKKRKATRDASGSTLPLKKLRDDYGTSSASASTSGKSRAVMHDLLNNNKLAAEIRITTAATVPLITSFVTPTPEREGVDHTDSISGPNLRTKSAAVRFVISSDSSHHSGTHAVDVEVSSLVRYTILDPPVMTAAVATTAAVGTSLVSVSKVTVKPVNPTIFGDSMSTSGHDVAGPSILVHRELSADSFYAIQDMNPETLHRVYVPKWTVTNESFLDDPYMCHTLTDHLAPPALFSQLHAMEYDQLYAEFNVGATRQTCLGAEVRMRAEYTLRKKKILEDKCAQQTNLLKERDAEISILKSKLLLKEAEAAEAIHGRVATIEAAEALHAAELNLLKKRNSTLEAKMRASEAKATTLESKKNGLTDQTTCAKLRNQVAGYEIFKEQIEAVQDEQLTVIKCLQSPEYLSVLGRAIGRAVDKGMQDGLAAGIEHGKAGRSFNDVAAHNPSADADYVTAVNALRNVDFSLLTLLASQKDASIANIMDSLRLEGPVAKISGAGELQPSHEQLMLLIHRPKNNVVLRETSLSFSLEVIHNRIQRIRGDAEARRLSLSDAMVTLIEPLSSEDLLGEVSTTGVPVTADVVTTLSTTFAQSVLVSIPSLSVADHGDVHAELQVDDPSSGGIVFEKEELETSPEPVVGS
ncbi:hypothetical protein Tco_0974803 [Tanacetum coccineum]|uniref:Transposase (Putative), gypsy type n=1 Tax=Tanacetum coccineum TaxID=301880 RepID=A0ABQ5ECK1_9ASTR